MYEINNLSNVVLGQFQEQNSRSVLIDVSEWKPEENSVFSIIARRPTENTDYFVENVEVNENILKWTLSAFDMFILGQGKATIIMSTDTKIMKTPTFNTIINESLPNEAEETPPEPIPNWYTNVLLKADEIIGSRVESFNINEQGHLIATLEDGTTQDLGNVVGSGKVSSVNGQTGDVVLTANDVNSYSKSETDTKLSEKQNVIDSSNKLPYNLISGTPTIPTKTSDLTNDSGFITNAVNNLINYYLKSETYNKTEVNNLISQIQTSHFEVVTVLPATGESNVIYLLPRQITETGNIYDEYIYISNAYEKIGSTDVDLTGYATETWVSAQISSFLTQTQIQGLINTSLTNYYTKSEIDTALSSKENIVNKVTSISAQSTDTQYPTVKCLYDIIGDIESLLSALR